MSVTRVVHSLGLPYFALKTKELPTYAIPDGGFINCNITFIVHQIPVQRQYEDEIHPIFAIADHRVSYTPAPNVFEFGVTPSGQFAIKTMFNDGLWTTTSLVLTNDAVYSIDYLHDPSGIGAYLVVSETTAFAQDAVFTVFNGALEEALPLVPVKNPIPMFFNGCDATGRCPTSIISAAMYFYTYTPAEVSGVIWDFDEGTGDKVYARFDDNLAMGTSWWTRFGVVASDFDLSPAFFDPSPYYAKPYGDVPDASLVGSAYKWDILTRYVKRSFPTTLFSKMTFPSTTFSKATMPTTTYTKAVSTV